MPRSIRLLPIFLILISALSFVSCAHEPAPPVLQTTAPAAISGGTTQAHRPQATASEAERSRRYEVFPPAAQSWSQAPAARPKVLTLAPPAAAQPRQGATKPADAGTGSLAFMLNKLADCPVMYT